MTIGTRNSQPTNAWFGEEPTRLRSAATWCACQSAAILQKLTDSGIETIEQLADTPIAELTNIKGVGPKSAEKIIESVKEYYTRQSEEPATEETATDSVTATAEESPVAEDVAASDEVSVESADAAGATEAESSSKMESEHAIDSEASKQEE